MSWARDVWPSERARLMSGHMMPIEREAAEATVEILELEEWFEDDVRCESTVNHPLGIWGHVPGEAAAYRVKNACGHSFNLCAGWVFTVLADYAQYECKCGAVCESRDAIVVPI